MTKFSTEIPENKADTSTFTNPFTNAVSHRGKLQVQVDQDEVVGSEAQAIMDRQVKYIPATTHPDFPAILDVTHIAIGPFVSSFKDNLFFDAVLNVGTSAVFGYNHPKIFPRLQRLGSVLAGFVGAGTDFFFTSRHGAPAAQDLAELMTTFASEAYGGEFMMNFANAGTEANENAVKVAMFRKFRQVRQMLGEDLYRDMCEQLGITLLRPKVDDLWTNYPFFLIAFHGAFHGRTGTSNTLSMSKSRQKEGYQSVPYVVHVPYGDEVDFSRHIDFTPLAELVKEKRLRQVIESRKAPADLVAALVMESVQGEGGYVIPNKDFLKKLSDFVGQMRPRGMCFISDEVQTGLFRTGEFSGMQNWYKIHPNLRPDLMSFAKPLHVGGVLIDKNLVSDWPGGKFSGTWAEGNLLSIATACFTLEELRSVDPTLNKPYPDHAKESGQYLRELIAKMGDKFDKKMPGARLVENVRGLGPMNAFDVPNHDFQEAIIYQSFRHGLHILGTGERSIRIFSTVDQRKREAEMLIEILGQVIEKVADQSCTKEKSAIKSV